jgi:C-terminal processing protease CtpA/Prc
MDDSPEFLNSLIPAMHQLQHTKGLIIDVRGNGGGTRHALRLLFPFFLHPDDPPRLYTVATLRIPENETRDDPEGYLADRFLYPLTSSVWSVTEQEFVQAFAAKFKVTWQPPQEQFSALHYGILTHNQDHFYYSQPVIVLHNQRCASATDIFLGAFKGWRNTTLIGLNSAGTSGRPRQYTLEQSGIRFMASSMVSYRPDGQLYEGLGTQADIELGVTMTDLQGQTDSVLEAALKRLTT